MEITGKIKRINDVQTITETFKKRTFAIDYVENPTYPQVIEITLPGKSIDLIDKYKAGDNVKVLFNLKGRESNTKNGLAVFNTLEAWRIESAGESVAQSTQSTQSTNSTTKNTPAPVEDDLPF